MSGYSTYISTQAPNRWWTTSNNNGTNMFDEQVNATAIYIGTSSERTYDVPSQSDTGVQLYPSTIADSGFSYTTVSLNTSSPTFTLEMGFRLDDALSVRTLWSIMPNSGTVGVGHAITLIYTPGTGIQLFAGSTTVPIVTASGNWADGSYHIVTVCFLLGTGKLFVDGVSYGQAAASMAFQNTNQILWMGICRGLTTVRNPFYGIMDEVTYWTTDRSLTAGRIAVQAAAYLNNAVTGTRDVLATGFVFDTAQTRDVTSDAVLFTTLDQELHAWRGGTFVLGSTVTGNPELDRFRGGFAPANEMTQPYASHKRHVFADGYVDLGGLAVSANGYVIGQTGLLVTGDGLILSPTELTADAIVTAPNTRLFPRKANPSGRTYPLVP